MKDEHDIFLPKSEKEKITVTDEPKPVGLFVATFQIKDF